MNSLYKILSFLFIPFILSACNYNGKFKTGNYLSSNTDKNKISARVMVVSDRFIQKEFIFNDQHLTPVNQYIIQLDEGAAVNAAEALYNVFQDVSVDEYKNRKSYDYLAEIDYSLEAVPLLNYQPLLYYNEYARKNISFEFTTRVNLTLRNSKTDQAVISLKSQKTDPLTLSTAKKIYYYANKASFNLLFFISSPLYTQVMGGALRDKLQEDFNSCLQEIMEQLEENRIIFSSENKLFYRQDKQYEDLFKKTIYLLTDQGHATGFFITKNGYILTNAHAVGEERDLRYYLYEDLPFDQTSNSLPFRYARVVRKNKSRDVALLKAEGDFPFFDIETNPNAYQTGQSVVAIGHPSVFFWGVSEGIISSSVNHNGVNILQTDAAVSFGNSGGPLVDTQSKKVVGIISWKHKENKDDLGTASAITACEVQRTLGFNPLPDKTDIIFTHADDNGEKNK